MHSKVSSSGELHKASSKIVHVIYKLKAFVECRIPDKLNHLLQGEGIERSNRHENSLEDSLERNSVFNDRTRPQFCRRVRGTIGIRKCGRDDSAASLTMSPCKSDTNGLAIMRGPRALRRNVGFP